jgi:glutathione S-transferase
VLVGIPKVAREIMAPFARRGVLKQMKGHGMGCHNATEIAAIAARDIGALADILGEQQWFFGDEPTETDCVVYSLLANIHQVGFASPMKPVIAGNGNLVSFLERFAARFYPA